MEIITYVSKIHVATLFTALNCYLAKGVLHMAVKCKDKLIELHWLHVKGVMDLEDFDHLHNACIKASRKVAKAELDKIIDNKQFKTVDLVESGAAFDLMWEQYAGDCKSRVKTCLAGFKCLLDADPFDTLPACEFKDCQRFKDAGE